MYVFSLNQVCKFIRKKYQNVKLYGPKFGKFTASLTLDSDRGLGEGQIKFKLRPDVARTKYTYKKYI